MERSTSDERCVPVPARLLPPPGGRSRFYAGQDFELAPTSPTVPILRHDNGNEVRACSRFMADSPSPTLFPLAASKTGNREYREIAFRQIIIVGGSILDAALLLRLREETRR